MAGAALLAALAGRLAEARGMVFPYAIDAAGKDYTLNPWFG